MLKILLRTLWCNAFRRAKTATVSAEINTIKREKIMKKTAALLAILAVCSAPVLAQNGGFVDPNAPATQTTQTTQAAGGFNGHSAGAMTVESQNDE